MGECVRIDGRRRVGSFLALAVVLFAVAVGMIACWGPTGPSKDGNLPPTSTPPPVAH